jgi:hypothetical protein
MQETLGFVVIGVFVASSARWIYVHWRFWSILRDEQPVLSKELSGVAFAHARGLGWINFALERKYRGFGSERLQKAGDALVNAYGRFQMSWAFLWLAFAILFGVSLLLPS